MMKSPIGCFATKNSIAIGPNLDIRPCCRYNEKYGLLSDYNSIADIMNGKDYTQLHNSLSNGKWDSGCGTCEFAEANGIRSRRMSYVERFQDEDFLLDLALGNYCNLKCRMCSEDLSTSWFADAVKLGRPKPKVWQVTREQIDSIIDFVSDKKSLFIELKGGEPLLNPQCQYFFEKLKTLDIPVKIIVTSNGTDTPDWFLDACQKFDIDYQISVDGMYDAYEYVRGDRTFTWEQCANRIQELEESVDKLSYNYVVQNLTVHHMLDFTQFVNKSINWIMLDNPKYLACNVIPERSKPEIIEKIEKIEKISKNDFTKLPGFVNMIRNKCSNQTYLEFMIVSKKLDSLRGQSLEKTFPHLIE
jgi:MoaA/NifB/PqqE/SkfB family radical SAM enzyme